MSAMKRTQAQKGVLAPDDGTEARTLVWPSDAKDITPADIDFEAVAHVLANTCRWGGRCRRFYALAQHAVVASEEIEALDGLEERDRRTLALHALLANARAAWLGDDGAGGPASAKATDRARRDGAALDRVVREAAGLDPELPDEWAEILRFVLRMTDAAERRDVLDGNSPGRTGPVFPPLKRRIRPVRPAHAAQLWLARFHALSGPPGAASSETKGKAGATTRTNEEETPNVTHLSAKKGESVETPRSDGQGQRDAA